jgi:hypothetical protein
MRPKVTRTEIKVTLTMATVLLGLLVALALLAMPSAGAHPPLEGPGGQGGVTVTSTVPTMISYQGQLLSNGNPVTGTYTMTFSLYSGPTGGTSVWQETQSVTVTNGLFNVLLGSAGSPLSPPLFTGTTYLGVKVGSSPEMTPRQQIVSVSYAFVADTAKNGGGWTEDTGVVHLITNTDKVGIGTSNPTDQLDVACPITSNSYISLDPDMYGGGHSVGIMMNEFRNHNYLLLSAYDELWGNILYTQDPGANSGQGFGIAGGSAMAPFDRFVVNADEMFLGYSIRPGDGSSSGGLNAAGNLYVRGKVGIGTTSPQSTLQVEGSPGYLQIDSNNGTPPALDCDSNNERGRMILDFANNRLYVCTGSGGWKYATLQ